MKTFTVRITMDAEDRGDFIRKLVLRLSSPWHYLIKEESE